MTASAEQSPAPPPITSRFVRRTNRIVQSARSHSFRTQRSIQPPFQLHYMVLLSAYDALNLFVHFYMCRMHFSGHYSKTFPGIIFRAFAIFEKLYGRSTV